MRRAGVCAAALLGGVPANLLPPFHLFRNKKLRSAVGGGGMGRSGRRDVSKWELYWTGDVGWAETEV